ncbi:MAG: hypothetical protein N2999_02190 [Proteobacteria bacterium]|nr:hypothetical protein [Pseudomonadota bacterium]
MELDRLKRAQEDLKSLVRITPFNFFSGNVAGVDSSYMLKNDEIISTAVVYNTIEKKIIERSYCKKKFLFPTSPVFSPFVRLTPP